MLKDSLCAAIFFFIIHCTPEKSSFDVLSCIFTTEKCIFNFFSASYLAEGHSQFWIEKENRFFYWAKLKCKKKTKKSGKWIENQAKIDPNRLLSIFHFTAAS